MKSTFSITEAQAQLSKITRGNSVVGFSKHNKVVGFYIPRERLDSLLETMEILANPEAMRVLNASKKGKLKYYTLEECEKEWGMK